jgi:hypothetical protein
MAASIVAAGFMVRRVFTEVRTFTIPAFTEVLTSTRSRECAPAPSAAFLMAAMPVRLRRAGDRALAVAAAFMEEASTVAGDAGSCV